MPAYGYTSPGPGSFNNLSGIVQVGSLGSGAVQSGNIGYGAIGQFHIASGQLLGFELASGSIVSGRIASGQIGFGHLANASIQSGTIASGVLDRLHHNSGCVIDYFPCEQAISGIIAVAWGSGGCAVVPAERRSGLRMPAIGIVAGNFLSGAIVPVVRDGYIGVTFSGGIASGQFGRYLYVGSGGLLVNMSGYMGGLSSGNGPNPVLNTGETSGCMVQPVAISVSGGLDVQIGDMRSGLISGLLGQF